MTLDPARPTDDPIAAAWDEAIARIYAPRPTGLMTVQQTAVYFDVHKSTIWRWIRDGQLPVHRPGPRTVRVRLEDAKRLGAPPDPYRPDAG